MTEAIKAGSNDGRKMKELQKAVINEDSRKRKNGKKEIKKEILEGWRNPSFHSEKAKPKQEEKKIHREMNTVENMITKEMRRVGRRIKISGEIES